MKKKLKEEVLSILEKASGNLAKGNFEEAITSFELVIQNKSLDFNQMGIDRGLVLRDLGTSHLGKGDIELAKKYHFESLNADTPEGYLEVAKIYSSLIQDHGQVIKIIRELYDKAIEDGYYQMGKVWSYLNLLIVDLEMSNGNIETAKEQLEIFFQEVFDSYDIDYPDNVFSSAENLIDVIKEKTEEIPKDLVEDILVRIGTCYFSLKADKFAYKVFDLILETTSGPVATTDIGYFLARNEKKEESKKFFEKSLNFEKEPIFDHDLEGNEVKKEFIKARVFAFHGLGEMAEEESDLESALIFFNSGWTQYRNVVCAYRSGLVLNKLERFNDSSQVLSEMMNEIDMDSSLKDDELLGRAHALLNLNENEKTIK